MPCAFRGEFDRLARSDRGCQFAVPEDELVKFNDQTWCCLHLPLKAKEDWTREQIAVFNDKVFNYIRKAEKENKSADMSGVIFPGEISFKPFLHLPSISFHQATFGGSAIFNLVTFDGGVTFRGASFGYAAFERANFRKDAMFEGASFGYAVFENANFDGEARFEGANFDGDVRFDHATFHGRAKFMKAIFAGNTRFERVSFGCGADFSTINENAQSKAAAFHSVNFAGVKFITPATAPYLCNVRFNNRKFLDTTNFSKAYFEIAPEFHGCILHQDTVFPQETNFRDRKGRNAARAYRTIKHAMAGIHARGEEAKFYALEQESLLHDEETPISIKVFSILYWLASDYGQSVLRPLAGLLATFAAFLAIYFTVLFVFLDPFPPVSVGDVLRFALQQVFQPFEVFRVRAAVGAAAVPDVLQIVPLPLAFLAAVHSVLTLSLVTLFLLALRRRFKLD